MDIQFAYERSQEENQSFGKRQLVQLLLGLALWIGGPIALVILFLI